MNFRYILFFFAILLTSIRATSQNIDVKSFKQLPNDLDARVHEPVKDQNGDKCALIKVVTTEKGFVWEGGTLGITEVKNKAGEYWVYVPHGSKKITIKHEQLGVLRDYVYPAAIKKATVYEMKLTTGVVKTVVEEKELATQWLVIETEPEKASVFIDGKLAGTTPFQRKYEEGEYTYRIEKNRYHNMAGKIKLKNNKKRLELTLKPKFGNLKVTSAPENGMTIYIDEKNTGKKTPGTLERISSGEHKVTLESQWYQPQTKQVTIQDEQISTINFELEQVFATVSVETKPAADIIIDGEKKGENSWQGRLLEGVYTIKAEKENYYSDSTQLKVTVGQEENIKFDLKEKTGDADIKTEPIGATVYLNGKKQGTSPLTLNDKLVGEHEITIEKKGFETINKEIYIEENQTISIDEKLEERLNKPSYDYSDYTNNNSTNISEPSNANKSEKQYNGGPENMFLSLLIPGLGDKNVSGVSGLDRTLTTYGLIAGGIAFKSLSNSEYKKYHNATMQSDMDKYYKRANNYNKLFYVFTASGVILWIYDIIWVADKGFKNKKDQRKYTSDFNMKYNPDINGVAFSVKIKF